MEYDKEFVNSIDGEDSNYFAKDISFSIALTKEDLYRKTLDELYLKIGAK